MTIRTPPDNFLDNFLRIIGKKRMVIIPENLDKVYEKYGPHIQIQAKKENFIKTILRRSPK